MRDLKQDTRPIDIFSLEIEAANHASVYSEWASEYVEATNKLDSLKEKLSLLEGDIAKSIREDPEESGWNSDKPVTDAFINKAILSDEPHQIMKKEIVEATYEVNACNAAKQSLEHRGKMIGHLTELYKSNYFNTNIITPEQLEKKVRDYQLEQLKKNKRMKG
jgi:hypothetical protein